MVFNRHLLVAGLLLASGCAGGNVQGTSPPQEALGGTTWTLVAFGEVEDRAPGLEEAGMTAVFTGQDRLSGSTGCNRYFGTYQMSAERLDLSRMGSTRMACPPSVMQREVRFLSALESVGGWRLEGDTLDLLDGAGRRLLRFVTMGWEGGRVGAAGVAAPDRLFGRTWRLIRIETAAGFGVTPEVGETYTVTFGADGTYGGQADCNRFGGEYEAANDGGVDLDSGLVTLAACAPPSSSDAFFGVLNEVERYSVDGHFLRLHAADGGRLEFELDGQYLGGIRPQEPGRDYVYTCQGPDDPFTFRIRARRGAVALWLPERFEGREGGTYLVLGQVVSASGSKYRDGPVTVWTRGLDTALLEVDGRGFRSCARDASRAVWEEARWSGVDFRAIGQEPGWHLEIRAGERITFLYDYGERRTVVPAPEPTLASGRTVYHAETEAHDLTVTITDGPCADVMSGETFEATVTVELDGGTYRGCGRRLGGHPGNPLPPAHETETGTPQGAKHPEEAQTATPPAWSGRRNAWVRSAASPSRESPRRRRG